MASYHFTMKCSSDTNATAAMRADYICRENKYAEGTRAEELAYKDHENMPEWAKDNPKEFWRASDTYERSNGTTFREIEFALPNELNLEQQKQLIKEFTNQHFGKDFVYSYAIHSKSASLAHGIQNPHVHIMFCERKLDGINRSKETFFKRANTKNPERGGNKKDARWNDANRNEYLVAMRKHCAQLQNKYLELEGSPSRVDHRKKEIQYQDAIAKGDLDKAQLLEAPAERHLGPKVASKVSREIKQVTMGVTDVKERNKLRRGYWDSKKGSHEVFQLRQIRAWKKTVQDLHYEDQKRGPTREQNANEIAVKMFLRAKSKELNEMRSKLDLEKYRLERAEKNSSKNTKVTAWRDHYENRLLQYEKLKNKVAEKTLTDEDKMHVKKIADEIAKVESDKRISKEALRDKMMVPTLENQNVESVKVIQHMTVQKISELDTVLKALHDTEKSLQKKLYTENKARRIAEWRISGGLLAGIKRDEDKLKEKRKLLKEVANKIKSLPHSPAHNVQLVKQYELDKETVIAGEKAIKELSFSIQSRRKKWAMEKEKPETKQRILSLQNKIMAKNVTVQTQLSQVRIEINIVKQEKSEWRKIEYSLSQVKDPNRKLMLEGNRQQPSQILQQAHSIQSQLHQAVGKLHEERPRGGIGAHLKIEDEAALQQTAEYDMDR
jgi:hypothetical protein